MENGRKVLWGAKIGSSMVSKLYRKIHEDSQFAEHDAIPSSTCMKGDCMTPVQCFAGCFLPFTKWRNQSRNIWNISFWFFIRSLPALH